MRFSLLSLIVCIVLIFQFNGLKANTGKSVLDTGTVKQQLDYVISKSSTYEQYKVIKNTWVNQIQKNILDSLAAGEKLLTASNLHIEEQNSKLDSLNAAFLQTQNNLAQVTREKNSLKFLGILVSKTSYNSIMFSIIIILTLLLSVLFLAFKRNYAITARTKQDLIELKEEFETHRKNTREREERNARRHLDEILKYKNKQRV